MIVAPLRPEQIGEVQQLMELGEPYISARTLSDYWLYATLFSSTCPIAVTDDGTLVGAVIAFQSQDDPADVYVQDVMTHPQHRRRGIVRTLLQHVRSQAEARGCRRSEEHTSELQSRGHLVCRPLLEKKKQCQFGTS